MSTFAQWFKSLDKHPEPKQVTWVCGPERTLVDEVYQQIKTYINPSEYNLSYYNMQSDENRALWEDLRQQPLDRTRRLIVVRHAELIEDKSKIYDWVLHKSDNPLTYVVFISYAEALETQESEEKKPPLAEYLDIIKRRGKLVECKPFTNNTAQYAVQWVQGYIHCTTKVAGYLLDRANGDLRVARDTCKKIQVLPVEPSLQLVRAVLDQVPRLTFEEAILSMKKEDALNRLQEMDLNARLSVVGRLDDRLTLLGLVHDMMADYHSSSEIGQALGNRRFLLPELMPIAKHYNLKRRRSCRKLLASTDKLLREGAKVGVMETLVVFW